MMNRTSAHPEFADSSSEEALETQASEIGQAAQNTSRKLLTLLAISGFIFLALHFTPFGQQARDWDTLNSLFKTGGFQSELYFVLISALLIMAGVPRLLFYAMGGFAFGFWEGLLCSLLGSLTGSFIAFQAARWGGREWLSGRFGKQRFFGRIVHAKPTILSVALIRMLPATNVVMNFGLAFSHVDNRAFVLGSLIGFLPQGVVATIIGSGLAQDVPWAGAAQLGFAGILLVAIFVAATRQRRQR
jgi:uncharacterized membrane protein YdjX (TVP38/TMEM64 family)